MIMKESTHNGHHGPYQHLHFCLRVFRHEVCQNAESELWAKHNKLIMVVDWVWRGCGKV